jgi:hypothetical protein
LIFCTNVDAAHHSTGLSQKKKAIFGPDLIDEAEGTAHRIQDNLKAVKSSQESYGNKRHRPLEFEAGDHVYLRVSLMKSMKRFGVKGKLAPHDIGLFPILEKCGPVAYKLELPPSLTRVHDIFNMSQLKKCLKAPMDVVLPEVTPLEADLTYPKQSIKILDKKDGVRGARRSSSSRFNGAIIPKQEATWESEDFLYSHHSEFELP